MTALPDMLRSGTALFEGLREVLEDERQALVHYTRPEMEEANLRREGLLSELARWEEEAKAYLGEDGGPNGPFGTFSKAVETLPDSHRPTARRMLDEMVSAARETQSLAAINHILVERNLDVTRQTLGFITGNTGGATYDAQAGVRQGNGQGLIQRKG